MLFTTESIATWSSFYNFRIYCVSKFSYIVLRRRITTDVIQEESIFISVKVTHFLPGLFQNTEYNLQ